MARNLQRAGELAFAKMEKINSEVLTLTYGSIVAQLVKDYEDVEEVNKQLEMMGYNMGIRLVDEFLAKSHVGSCQSFRDSAEVIAKVGLRMFLGVSATVSQWSQDGNEFSLVMEENPLHEFVDIPEHLRGLYYCNILCGVIRGALEMLNMRVDAQYVRCKLRGDAHSEIRVKLIEILEDQYPEDDE